MGYAEEAMAQLGAKDETDWRRELEKRGQDIADAMGRYRGTESLVEAIRRLANDYHNASTRGYVMRQVEVELSRARETHAPMNSHHEGYAVILEKLDELWEVCKRNTHKVPHGFNDSAFQAEQRRITKRMDMRKEAIQVAAMAIRFIEDVCDK